MTDISWHEGGGRRAGRSEDKLLGDIEADDDATAERLAAEKWPSLRLSVERHNGDQAPSSPPRGEVRQ